MCFGFTVSVQSSILGSGGRTKEVQTEFLVLVEDAIRQPNLAKSVQRYQLAIDEAKVRLNLAVAPGAWLMPGRMMINTESVVGYNNQLKQAGTGTKLGINNDVNKGTKKVGITQMERGLPKMDRPTNLPACKAPGVPAQPTVHKTNKIRLVAVLALGAFAFSCAVL